MEEEEEEVAGNYLASVLTMFATRFLREGYRRRGHARVSLTNKNNGAIRI